jgi:hypothetical protein
MHALPITVPASRWTKQLAPAEDSANPTIEEKLTTVTNLPGQVAESVAALAAEAPRTAGRLDALEAGLSELLAATERIAARLDAEDVAL